MTTRPRGAGGLGARHSELARWIARLAASGPMQAVAAVGLLVFVMVLSATTLIILELRERERNDARRVLVNLGTALAEGTSRSLQGVDLVLQSLGDEVRAQGISTPDEFRRLKADRDTHEDLKAKISGLPQLDAISLIGVGGDLVNFSRAFPPPSIDLSDRDHFAALRRPGVEEPYLSEPVQNRGTGGWTVYVARRMLSSTGELLGLAYGALDLNYFEASYRALDLEPGSAIGLWHRDGPLLVRHPPVPLAGRTLRPPPGPVVAAAEASSVYETERGIDGQPRVVARRAVAGFPALMVASRTSEDVLSEWRAQAAVVGVSGALVAAAVLAVAVALARQFAAYEELASAVRAREAAIHARDEAEKQLRQSQKLEAMGQLTSGVAHDFNNLLTVVLGNLDLLGRRLAGDSQALGRYVEAARGGAERAAALTQRLLAFARRSPLEARDLDLNDLVTGMADLLRQSLGEDKTLGLQLQAGLGRIKADPNGLESALLNLVVNARDAMPGGGAVTIATRRDIEEETGKATPFARLTVGDTGTGMSPEVLRRAFEPFFTTKPVGVGTGLGLAQVYGFAKQSAGDVRIESEAGQGTRIVLLLPLSPSEPATNAPSPAATAAGDGGRPGGVVLVVDDDDAVRRFSVEVLAVAGYTVIEAADGLAGLRIVDSRPLDAVFSDIGLPGMDGRDLVEEAARRRPGLAILLTSGYAPDALKRAGRREPDAPVLRKPFTADMLIEALARRLADRPIPAMPPDAA